MIKTFKNAIFFFFILAFFFISCKKDSDNTTNNGDNTLIISPNFLIGITAQDWVKVEPQLKDKRNYLYTELPQDVGGQYKAAVSLPAYDTSYGKKTNCSISLNILRSNNKVTGVIMGTNDSLSPLSQDQTFALENYYYINGLKPLTDTIRTYAYYDDGTGFQAPITVNDAVLKLTSNYNTNAIGIGYGVGQYSVYTINCFKSIDNERYTFSFTGFGQ